MPQDIHRSYIEKLLVGYQHPQAACKDITNAIKNYKNLSPKLEPFVFNDGSQRKLVCLEGTIPVSYKGSTYNIPICIWLLETHPYNSPICYVKPTPQMEIKTSCHVDTNGRIFLPYLHDWHYKNSDLLGLIQVMIIVFGDSPPVYTKRKPPQNSYNTPYPVPAVGYPPVPSPYPTPTSTPYPPAPYPTPYPSTQPTGYPPVSTQPPVSGAYPPYPSMPPPTHMNTTSVSTPSSLPPYPTPYPPATPTTVATTQQQGTITEEHIHASLLSAVEDKLKKRLNEVLAQAQAEMDVLKKTHDDLTTGKNKLESFISSLDEEKNTMERNIIVLREKSQEMKELISKLESEDTIDLDEVVVTTTPVYKQLLNAHAEENATEDAIYYLGEALRKGVIDLDVFLKHVRQLSRKQFMLKALMQKARQKAWLPY